MGFSQRNTSKVWSSIMMYNEVVSGSPNIVRNTDTWSCKHRVYYRKTCQQATYWCWMKQRVGTAINIKFGRSTAIGPLKLLHFDLKIWTNMFEGWDDYPTESFCSIIWPMRSIFYAVTLTSELSSLHCTLKFDANETTCSSLGKSSAYKGPKTTSISSFVQLDNRTHQNSFIWTS